MPEWVNDELITVYSPKNCPKKALVQLFLYLQSIIVSFQPYLSI